MAIVSGELWMASPPCATSAARKEVSIRRRPA
jgi:hypothetical protein